MPRKKTETSAAKAEPKSKAVKSSLDVFIETRLAGTHRLQGLAVRTRPLISAIVSSSVRTGHIR